MQRRHFLAASAATALSLAGCEPAPEIRGGFNGIAMGRGHELRDRKTWPAPARTQRTRVVIAGGGVAGLAAARALRLQGVHDFVLLELEDVPGGNSRGTQVGGLPCPMGAHYLPTPGDDAPEVQELLEELGLRQRLAGRWQWAERHLCHSPQERLFFRGQWQDGLLPLADVGATTLAQYRRFSALVEQLRLEAHWVIPSTRAAAGPVQLGLDRQNFAQWLEGQGLSDTHLRWYLDYCCRDDYGAGLNTVSAWAGLHYFASRHGFHVPGDSVAERDAVFTWPEGNSWLTQRLAAPLMPAGQLHSAQVVLRIAPGKHGVEVDGWDVATQSVQRWQAEHCIVALPVQVAARVVQPLPELVRARASGVRYAPWLVANVHIGAPLRDRPGAAPSWDNVIYRPGAQQSLGYVDATHQNLAPVPGATVLTWYQALGDVDQGRRQLQDQPWSFWRDALLEDLSTAHPDLREKATQIAITRYGHAMAMPLPGTLAQRQAWAPRGKNTNSPTVPRADRLVFAHSDWAGYSVFEEAFTLGHAAARAIMPNGARSSS